MTDQEAAHNDRQSIKHLAAFIASDEWLAWQIVELWLDIHGYNLTPKETAVQDENPTSES